MNTLDLIPRKLITIDKHIELKQTKNINAKSEFTKWHNAKKQPLNRHGLKLL